MFKFNISPVGAARVTDSTLGGFDHKITLPGKHTKNYGTSPSLIGKSTINGQFSIATLENHRVTSREKNAEHKGLTRQTPFFPVDVPLQPLNLTRNLTTEKQHQTIYATMDLPGNNE